MPNSGVARMDFASELACSLISFIVFRNTHVEKSDDAPVIMSFGAAPRSLDSEKKAFHGRWKTRCSQH